MHAWNLVHNREPPEIKTVWDLVGGETSEDVEELDLLELSNDLYLPL